MNLGQGILFDPFFLSLFFGLSSSPNTGDLVSKVWAYSPKLGAFPRLILTHCTEVTAPLPNPPWAMGNAAGAGLGVGTPRLGERCQLPEG